MPRFSTSASSPTSTPSTSSKLLKAANRAKGSTHAAGHRNIVEALKIFKLGDRFANPVIALGYADELAESRFTSKQLTAYEERGRALLERLGISEEALEFTDNKKEVVVSIPLGRLGDAEPLQGLGLRRSALSTTRGFVEYRGAAELERVRPLVGSLDGLMQVVERPAANQAPGNADETSTLSKPADIKPANGVTEPAAPAKVNDVTEGASDKSPVVAPPTVGRPLPFARPPASAAALAAASGTGMVNRPEGSPTTILPPAPATAPHSTSTTPPFRPGAR